MKRRMTSPALNLWLIQKHMLLATECLTAWREEIFKGVN